MLGNLLYTLGWAVIIAFFVMYLSYCIGLSKVFERLNVPRWPAYIPLYNFRCLISVLHLPKKWFILSLTPYIGIIYSVAVAYRLGQVFGRKLAFSAFWLIAGSPLGMPYIGYRVKTLHIDVLDHPPPNLKELERSLSKLKNKKNKKV